MFEGSFPKVFNRLNVQPFCRINIIVRKLQPQTYVVKPVFEIVPEAIFFLETNLICEVGPHGFYFVFENDVSKKFHGLSAYHFPTGSDTNRNLKQIFHEHPLLGKSYRKVMITWAGNECTLLPEELYLPGENEMLLDKLFGNMEDSAVAADIVSEKNICNVYRMPAVLHKTLVEQFPVASFHHYYSLLIRQGMKGEGMKLVFNNESFTVMFTRNEMLQLIQTYPYESTADVLYHLKNIQTRFSAGNVALQAAGVVDPLGVLAKEMEHYFGKINYDSLPGEYEYAEGLKVLPAHYFSHLYSYAKCV